jgi:hypothetical protein
VFSKWPMSKCYKEGQLAVSQVTAGVQLLWAVAVKSW